MITIVWHTSRENSWESDWIEHLFRYTPHQTILDYLQTQFIDRSYIVYNASVNIQEYVKKLSATGKKFGLIHLSDEWDRDIVEHYPLANVVLRNYYKDLGNNVINFPLGCMNTFPYDLTINTLNDRKYTWSFSGHIDKTTRYDMAKYMSTVPNGQSYFKTCGQYHGYALTPLELSNLTNDSIFVPCPHGNCSIDSFRVYETLQAGALPIVESNPYWSNLLGNDHPLIEISDWSQAPSTIQTLLSDSSSLEQQRLSAHKWWIKYCDDLSNKLTGIL